MLKTLLRIIRAIIFYFVLLVAFLMVSCSVVITFDTPPTDKETAAQCRKNIQGLATLSSKEIEDSVGRCMEDAWKGDGAAGAFALIGYVIGMPILVGYGFWLLRRRRQKNLLKL
jgi:hypothetical protein